MHMLDVQIIPALTDNYIFHLATNQQNIVIDPGTAQPVFNTLGDQPLHTILITHHHHDHIGGVSELKKAYNCNVIAYPNPTDAPATLDIADQQVDVLHTPGHTSDHLSFYWPGEQVLFCGDTLFTGGCGRLLSGTAEQMFNSLQQIAQLPADTKVYSAHEYTVANYRFAAHYAPENPIYQERLAWAEAQRAQNQPTVPTTIAEERRSNIFLQTTSVAEFIAIRQAKDRF